MKYENVTHFVNAICCVLHFVASPTAGCSDQIFLRQATLIRNPRVSFDRFLLWKGKCQANPFSGGKSCQDKETVATDTKMPFFILGSKFCRNGQFQYQMTTKCDFQMTAWFTIQVRKRKYHLRLSKESSCPDVLSSQHELKLAKNTREKKCYSIDPKLGKWQMTDVNWQLQSDRSNPTYCHCSPAQVC